MIQKWHRRIRLWQGHDWEKWQESERLWMRDCVRCGISQTTSKRFGHLLTWWKEDVGETRMKQNFWRLSHTGPVPCSAEEWEKHNADMSRRIGHDVIARVMISTIFMGINTQADEDGPPLLYETLIFDPATGRREESYATATQAREGHRRWVEHFRAQSRGDEQPK